MRFLPFVVKHLRRSLVRTASTVAAIALCVFLFCALKSVLAEVDRVVLGRSPRRLITKNAMEMWGLPLSHAPRIQALPGVRRVAAWTMFGGFLQAKKQGAAGAGTEASEWSSFFHNLAVEAEPYFAMSPELLVAPDQFRAFLEDRAGCLVGRKLAEKFEWKIGDRFFLESIVPGFRKPTGPFEFVVRGFVDTDLRRYPGASADGMFFHLKYLDVLPRMRGWTVFYLVEVEEAARAGETSGAIDALFENSSEQTITEAEQVFFADFARQAGDLSVLLNGIGLAVCFSILLVTANTMSMAVRERRTEIAVLKTLGFTSTRLLGLIVAEGVLLGGLGGALGVGGTQAVLALLNRLPGMALPGLSTLELRWPVAGAGLLAALVIGFAASFMPAWGAYRARVTEMLRTV